MSEDAAAALIRALVQNLDGADADWTAFALVLVLNGGKFNEAHGYAYGPGTGSAPVAVRPRLVRPEVEAYLAEHFAAGDALPLKLLVRFDRSKRRYEVTFEDKDADRWRVTPANIDQIREELRPKFD